MKKNTTLPLKKGVTKNLRVVNLYAGIIFRDNCILHGDIIRFEGMNIIVVRPPWAKFFLEAIFFEKYRALLSAHFPKNIYHQ